MESEHHDVIVIGGGQARLSASYYLTQQGREHIVLERGRIGETWRSKRWDSFTLVTPNWTGQLPGFPYDREDPDGFMPRDEIANYLERYAETFKMPVLCGVRVVSLEQNPDGGFLVRTDSGAMQTRNVIVASGPFQVPKIPTMASGLPTGILQLHTDDYKNPLSLPDDALLVVGTGQSGCQIAEELIRDGRKVYLATSDCGRVPRWYRGKDIVWWMEKIGMMDDLVETLPPPGAKFNCNPHFSGKDGGHEINLRDLAEEGVILLGHLEDIRDGKITFAPNLRENLAKADQFASDIIKKIHDHMVKSGMNIPEEERPKGISKIQRETNALEQAMHTLNLKASAIKTMIWASGYKLAFEWVHLLVFDDTGYPIHRRGVTSCPGLYFLGLNWLYKRKSCLFLGVGEDAEYITSIIGADFSHRRIEEQMPLAFYRA